MIGVVVGFAAVGMSAGRFMVGVSLLPARTAWDAAWPRLQARGEAAFDDALAGPLTEHLARSLGDTTAARQAYRRYLEARRIPDPSLLPLVRQVQAEADSLQPRGSALARTVE